MATRPLLSIQKSSSCSLRLFPEQNTRDKIEEAFSSSVFEITEKFQREQSELNYNERFRLRSDAQIQIAKVVEKTMIELQATMMRSSHEKIFDQMVETLKQKMTPDISNLVSDAYARVKAMKESVPTPCQITIKSA